MVREPDATMQPPPQDNQLMSKHRVLSIKPQLRLEWRGQDGQNETEQPDHSASLGDSITSSTRIRFSVHTVVLPKQAWPLYAGFRSMPQTVERSHRPRRLQVGIACSFKRRAMAPMLSPERCIVRTSTVQCEPALRRSGSTQPSDLSCG